MHAFHSLSPSIHRCKHGTCNTCLVGQSYADVAWSNVASANTTYMVLRVHVSTRRQQCCHDVKTAPPATREQVVHNQVHEYGTTARTAWPGLSTVLASPQCAIKVRTSPTAKACMAWSSDGTAPTAASPSSKASVRALFG